MLKTMKFEGNIGIQRRKKRRREKWGEN